MRKHLTYANVMATLAVAFTLGGGVAYAANTVFSEDIVDGEVKNADIASNAVTSNRIFPGSVTNTDIGENAVDGSKVLDGSLTGSDVASGSILGDDIGDNQVGSEDVRNQGLAEGGLTAIDIQNSSLTGGDIAPESLRGNDVLDGTVRTADVDDEGLTGADVDNQSGVDTCTHGSVRFGELCFFDPHESVPWRDALALCAEREMRLPSLGEGMSLVANYDIPDIDEVFFWTEEYFSGPSSDGSVWSVSEFTAPGFINEENSGGVSVVCVTTPTN